MPDGGVALRDFCFADDARSVFLTAVANSITPQACLEIECLGENNGVQFTLQVGSFTGKAVCDWGEVRGWMD